MDLCRKMKDKVVLLLISNRFNPERRDFTFATCFADKPFRIRPPELKFCNDKHKNTACTWWSREPFLVLGVLWFLVYISGLVVPVLRLQLPGAFVSSFTTADTDLPHDVFQVGLQGHDIWTDDTKLWILFPCAVEVRGNKTTEKSKTLPFGD